MGNSRRTFLKNTALGSAGAIAGGKTLQGSISEKRNEAPSKVTNTKPINHLILRVSGKLCRMQE